MDFSSSRITELCADQQPRSLSTTFISGKPLV
jgi:hypothetical protein